MPAKLLFIIGAVLFALAAIRDEWWHGGPHALMWFYFGFTAWLLALSWPWNGGAKGS